MQEFLDEVKKSRLAMNIRKHNVSLFASPCMNETRIQEFAKLCKFHEWPAAHTLFSIGDAASGRIKNRFEYEMFCTKISFFDSVFLFFFLFIYIIPLILPLLLLLFPPSPSNCSFLLFNL